MFSSLRTSPLAQRTFGALDLARSFLLLEDDYAVDWEVDRDEPQTPVHPHRAPLRKRFSERRPGSPLPAPQDCISPTFYGQPAMRRTAGATRESELSARRGSYPEGHARSGAHGTRDGRPETRATRCRPSGCDRHDRLA